MFITLEDYEGVINSEELHVISAGSDAIRMQAEKKAISKIKKMIARQYDADSLFAAQGESRDETLLEYSIYYTLYILYTRIAKKKVPEDRYEQYREAKDFFEAVRIDSIDTGWARNINTETGEEQNPAIRFGNNSEPLNHYY